MPPCFGIIYLYYLTTTFLSFKIYVDNKFLIILKNAKFKKSRLQILTRKIGNDIKFKLLSTDYKIK